MAAVKDKIKIQFPQKPQKGRKMKGPFCWLFLDCLGCPYWGRCIKTHVLQERSPFPVESNKALPSSDVVLTDFWEK